MNNNNLNFNIKDRITPILPLIILFTGIFGYTILFSYISLMRHWTYYSAYMDLGWFEQALWTTTQGHFFYVSYLESSHFGTHNSPILFLLLPFYYLFPFSETLLIIQTILLAIGAIPLFFIGKKILDNWGGCVFSLVYLLYPALHGINLFDFHELAFLPVLLFSAIYYLITDRTKYFILLSLLALLIKEDVSILLFALTTYAIYTSRYNSDKEKLTLYGLLLVYFIWLIVSLFWIIPHFNPDGYIHTSRYVLSDGIIAPIINNFFLKIVYVLLLLLPLGFTPLIAPEFLIISLPSFAEILLQWPVAYRITTQYSALVIPILFTSAIFGFKKLLDFLEDKFTLSKKNLYCVILLCGLTSCIFCTPAPISPFTLYYQFSPNSCEYFFDHHTDLIDEALLLIPGNSSVTAQNNLASHLARRMNIYINYQPNVEYIIIDGKTSNLDWLNTPIGYFPSNKYEIIFNHDEVEIYRIKEEYSHTVF